MSDFGAAHQNQTECGSPLPKGQPDKHLSLPACKFQLTDLAMHVAMFGSLCVLCLEDPDLKMI